MSQISPDPFGTAGLRAAVLDAWRASPTRLREDANVEEDYALGAYRDRLVVELAQNAADAAASAGVPGAVLFRIAEDALVVANVGAPLTREGVESLASMRASAKGADSVGHFGVGFAAVLAVTDAPEVRSVSGGVRFDRAATRASIDDDPTLVRILAGLEPPALRLPYACLDAPPEGFETAVVLPFRDDEARERTKTALSAIDDALLVALPSLSEVVVEVLDTDGDVDAARSVSWRAERRDDVVTVWRGDDARPWRVMKAHGTWSAHLDDDRVPTEQRRRDEWSVTCAVPVTADGRPTTLPESVPSVVHGPTPTDDQLTLPILVIADLPLDSSRRRVVEGRRASEVLAAAGCCVADLVMTLAADHGAAAASLIPEPTLAGWVDHSVTEAARQRLASVAWVPRAFDGALARAGELVALQPESVDLTAALAPHVSDLLAPEWSPAAATLRGLGLQTRAVNEVWDAAATLDIAPDQWRSIYEAASGLDRAALEGLPVPLFDGRISRDLRSIVLGEGRAEQLDHLGVPVVHPDAEHPLLSRLGVREFDPRLDLDHRVAERIEQIRSEDDAAGRAAVAAVAALVSDLAIAPGELDLGQLYVPVRGGGWEPATDVVMPGSTLDAVVDASVPRLDDALTQAAAAAWQAMGVHSDLTAVRVDDEPLDPLRWATRAADGDAWCHAVADLLDEADPADVFSAQTWVVQGLDLVGELDGRALFPLLSEPSVRRAVVEPVTVITGRGQRRQVPSPAAWWLSEAPLFGELSPVDVRLPGDDRLTPFFEEVDEAALGERPDVELLEAIGVHSTLDRWLAAPHGATELLELLADPTVDVAPTVLADIYRVLAQSVDDDSVVEAPGRLRAIVGDVTSVVAHDQVVVAIAPHHARVLRGPIIPGSAELAELLELDVSGDEVCGAEGLSTTGTGQTATSQAGTVRPVPDAVRLHGSEEFVEHDELTVAGVDVDWWVTDDGTPHACTTHGLAHALAWSRGEWIRRWELSVLLEHGHDDPTDRLYD